MGRRERGRQVGPVPHHWALGDAVEWPPEHGGKDILIVRTDDLKGFDAAIGAVFLDAKIQTCIVHQLRNSGRYVSYKDIKELMSDLKSVLDEALALDALDAFGDKWDKKYHKISKSWRDNQHIFQISAGDTETHIHDQRHRGVQQAALQSHKDEVCIPDRRQSAQDAVSCDGEHNEDVGGPPPGLGAYNRAADSVL